MLSAPWQKPFRGMQLNKVHPLAKGLVGCWVMNEKTGDKVFDLSSEGNNGTIIGADWVTEGLDFVAANNDYVTMGDIELPSTRELTIMTIIKPTTWSQTSGILNKRNAYNNENSYEFGLRPGTPTIIKFSTGGVNGNWANKVQYDWNSTGISTSNPTTLICSVDLLGSSGNKAKLYVNGVYISPEAGYDDSATAFYLTGTAPFSLGKVNETAPVYYNGDIISTIIYNRAISASEVAWLNREPYAMFQPPLTLEQMWYEAAAAASNLLHGKIIIKDSSIVLVDGLLQVKDSITNLSDGKIKVIESPTNLADGIIKVQDVATSQTDGKLRIKDSITNLADGKVQIQDTTTNQADGKLKVKDSITNQADGKVIVTTTGIASNLLDGKLRIKDVTTGIVDGLIKVKNTATSIIDGKLQVQDISTGLADGKLRIKDTISNLADGLLRIKDTVTGLIDGKVKIKNVVTGLADGKLIVQDTTPFTPLRLTPGHWPSNHWPASHWIDDHWPEYVVSVQGVYCVLYDKPNTYSRTYDKPETHSRTYDN